MSAQSQGCTSLFNREQHNLDSVKQKKVTAPIMQRSF